MDEALVMREISFGDFEDVAPGLLHLRTLRQVVLPIMVIKTDGTLSAIGTCFVVSCTGKQAVAFTAKHNIDCIMKVDGYRPPYAPSTPPEFRVRRYNNMGPQNLQMFVAFGSPQGEMIPCRLAKAWFPEEGPDVAITLLQLPESNEAVFTRRMAIMSGGPSLGDAVKAFGYFKMETSNETVDTHGVVEKQTLDLPLKQLPAKVVTRYSFGEHHLVKYPCFQIDSTLDHGMSGGPVAIEKDGNLVACGIVTSGSSFREEGIASLIFPVMIMRVDANFSFLHSKTPSLLDIEKHKMILDISEAHKHVYPNGSWSDSEIDGFTLEVSNTFSKADGTVVDFSKPMDQDRPFHWLSEECIYLGRINQHNSDNAEYYLISKAVREGTDAITSSGSVPNIQFVRAQAPHIWISVNESVYRFFVFAVQVPDHDRIIKVLCDAQPAVLPHQKEGD